MQAQSEALPQDTLTLGPLLAAVALVAFPHFFNLAPVVMAFFSLLVIWRVSSLISDVSPPSKALLFAMTIIGAAIVLFKYRRIWGQEPGSSLFIVGLGLKLMELKTLRDAYLVIFLSFFVALTQYLFSQSIPMAGYTLAIVVLLVTAMIGLNSSKAFSLRDRFKMTGWMVAQAIPAMILLFVLFPRIEGPLWHLPEEGLKGKTGLSETLAPGTVSRLSLSQELAFRVDFEGAIPPPRDLYWRGPVFWTTDGTGWKILRDIPLYQTQKLEFTQPSYHYTVTLEPHNQHWILALEMPSDFPGEFHRTGDYQLLSTDPITERKQYRITSYPSFTTGSLTPYERRKALELPNRRSAKVQQLVDGWTQQNPTPKDLVQQSLRFFTEEDFHYTLNPPITQGDPVENFLFETRRGFCEHYATAFVVMMRMGGVPARVVTGYQGGHWNPVGHFMEVKQADAHAWAEVWLEGTGWTRVDPTAAVAPERIERGLDLAQQSTAGEIRFNVEGAGFGVNGQGWLKFREEMRLLVASIEHQWDMVILAYGSENQSRFLEKLGVINWQRMVFWLIGGFTGLSLLLLLILMPKPPKHQDPAQRAYQRFLRKMAAYGLSPNLGEGVTSFTQRASQILPEQTDSLRHIAKLYQRLRYEPSQGPHDLQNLRRIIASIPKAKIPIRHRLKQLMGV